MRRNASLRPLCVLFVLLPAVTAGCTHPRSDAGQLLDADRAFNRAVARGGAEAWVSWFAPDGAMVQPGVGTIRGHDAIREAVEYLDEPGVSLAWEPDRADIAASGDLGWTTGRYTVVSPSAEGTRTSGGVYVSIWRRQPDGSWKVVMDLGNPVTDQDDAPQD